MRTTKELLKLCLREGNKKFKNAIPNDELYHHGYIGLCGFLSNLRHLSCVINNREFEILIDFIKHNRPKPNSPLCTKNHNNGSSYYWPKGQWAPRKRWLEYHIKNIENENN